MDTGGKGVITQQVQGFEVKFTKNLNSNLILSFSVFVARIVHCRSGAEGFPASLIE